MPRTNGALKWFANLSGRLATCAITEGAFIRVFLITSGQPVQDAQRILTSFSSLDRHVFLADAISYADVDCAEVVGHRQVTDAYLVGLAKHHGMVLATFDRALANLYPQLTVLV